MDDINETNQAPAPGFSIGGNVGGVVIQGNGNVVNAGSQPAPFDQPYEPQIPPARGELPEPGTLPPGSRIHAERNKNFTGREADLLALADALVYAPQPGALTVTQTIAGLGGIGKSQLAVEFCYRYGRFFRGVHWLDARQSLEVEIAACGVKMNLPNWPQTTPEQLRCTLNAWQRAPHRLLVLDNLEEPEILRKWKPELEGMSLLVTSRNPTWDTDLAAVRRLEVLARPESLLLLRRLAPRLESIPDDELSPLAERLGDLPLALDLAGRYLKDRPLTPGQYLEKLRETALKHPSLKATKAGSPTRHDTDVELTFLLSWEQLQDDPCDTLAKRFFIAAGYLAPNVPIPREIFCALAFPQAEWDETAEPDLSKYVELADEALLRLLSIGLLTETLSVHPLLAEFARAQDVGNAVLTALVDKMAWLSKMTVEIGIPANFVPLRPHIETLTPIAEHVGLTDFVPLWNNLGFYLNMIAEYSSARFAYEHALAILEKQLGVELPDLAKTATNLGEMLRAMGDLPEAKTLHERALAIFEKQHGVEHSDEALAVNNLGLVLRDMGNLQGAKVYFERALAIFEKQHGVEQSNVALVVNNMGLVLRDMGNLQDAKMYFEHALEILEKQLGAEHPQVALAVNNLGTVLLDMGDLPGAKTYYERALAIWEKQLGTEHPQVAFAVNNLGTVLLSMGNLPGAKTYYERAMAIWEKQLGAEHPNMAMVVNNLGEILRVMGDLPGAKTYYERALAIWEKQPNGEHPQTAFAINNLGLVLRDTGNLPGAKVCFERALAIWEKQLGPEHPSMAISFNNLGTVLKDVGDLLSARAYYERALAIDEKVYSKEHPTVARDLHNLAALLTMMEDLPQALVHEKRALAMWQKFLPPEHPNIQTAREILEEIERRIGKMQKAK